MSGVQLAYTFNNYFVSLTSQAHDSNYIKFLSNRQKGSSFLAPTSADETIHVFRSMKNSNYSDVDEFQIHPVKHALEIIAPALEHVLMFALMKFFQRHYKWLRSLFYMKAGTGMCFSYADLYPSCQHFQRV